MYWYDIKLSSIIHNIIFRASQRKLKHGEAQVESQLNKRKLNL